MNIEQPNVTELLPPSALESITRGEIDMQIATAHRYPRSLARFKAKAMEMACLDEDTAAACLYKLPRDGKIIEGESIRMAEIVAACYGNLRVQAGIISQTHTETTVRGVCHDLENNTAFAVEKQVRTTKKDGKPYGDDMRVTATNAGVSKVLRDVIFRVVPKSLIRSVTDQAKLTAVGTAATLQARRAKAMDWIKSLDIQAKRVFSALNIKGEADIGLEQLATITGIRTAIREGDITAAEAFPIVQDAPNFGTAKVEEKKDPSVPMLSAIVDALAQVSTLDQLQSLMKRDNIAAGPLLSTLIRKKLIPETTADILDLTGPQLSEVVRDWTAFSAQVRIDMRNSQ